MATLASLTIKLLGNTDSLVAALETAEKRAQRFEKDAGGSLQTFAKVAAGAVAAAGVAVAGGLGAAITAATGFEKSLSAIKAVSGASAQEMKELSALALQLGRDTSFSASEAAAGIEELVKGGVSIADIMGGAAQASLNLAAAGGVSLADAAEIAANAMAMFNLTGADMGMVADQIAGAANASSLSVTDFKFSLGAVGAVANLAGQSFQDTATAIALMGAAGIKGSDAGTSLKTMLMNLVPQTKAQEAAMRDLGLITADGANKFLDAAGNFRSLGEISGELSKALDGLSESEKTVALEAIFGSDAIRAASVMAKAGAEGFNEMAASMGKVTAESVAAERLNNFAGSLEQLKGSLETAAITLGMAFMPMLKQGADGLTGIVNAATPVLEVVGQRLVESVDGAKSGLERLWSATQPARDLLNDLGQVVQAWVLPALQSLTSFNFEEAFKGLRAGADVALVLLQDAFDGLAATITGWLQEQVSKVNWEEVWSTATGIATGLGAKLDAIDWSAAGEAIGSAFSRVLPEAIDRAFDTASDLAPRFLDGLKSIIAGIDFAAIGEAVTPKAIGFVLGVVNALFDLTMWAQVVMENWDKILLTIISIIAAPVGWIGKLTAALAKIPLVGSILAWLVRVISDVGKGFLGGVGGILGDMAGAFVRGFLEPLTGGGVALLPRLRAVITGAVDGIRDLAGNFFSRGLELMESLGRAVATHGPLQVLGALRTLFGLVDSFLTTVVGGMLKIGGNIITALWDGIRNLSGMLLTGVKQLIDSSISGPLKVAGTEMLTVGKAIVEGLANGIRNSVSLVMDAARNLAAMLPTWVKSVLGISSPSKVFAEIGENIGAGLALGIISKQDEVQEALSKLVGADQLESAVEGLVKGGNLAAAVEQLMAAGQTAEQALQKVSQVLQDIQREAEQANAAVAKALMDGLGKGTGDALTLANQAFADFQKQQWIQSLEEQITLASAEINKALAAGLDPAPIVQQALPLFEAYQQAMGNTEAAARRLAEAEAEALRTDRLEQHKSATASWRAALEAENDAIIESWNERAAAAQRAADIEISLARAQMEAGAARLARKIAKKQHQKNIADAFAAALASPVDEFNVGGLASLMDIAKQFSVSAYDIVNFAMASGVQVAETIREAVGFARGGSFTVGGIPGLDRNLVAFRATRGEEVTVTPPGRGGGGGAVAPNITVNVYNPHSEIDFRRAVTEAVRDAYRGGGLDFLGARP